MLREIYALQARVCLLVQLPPKSFYYHCSPFHIYHLENGAKRTRIVRKQLILSHRYMCPQQKINSMLWLTPFYTANLLLIEKKIICKLPYNANSWGKKPPRATHLGKMKIVGNIFVQPPPPAASSKRPELREIIKINALQFVRHSGHKETKMTRGENIFNSSYLTPFPLTNFNNFPTLFDIHFLFFWLIVENVNQQGSGI